MPKEHSPEAIGAKIAAGLTRDQAIEVLDRQRAHDLALEEEQDKAEVAAETEEVRKIDRKNKREAAAIEKEKAKLNT